MISVKIGSGKSIDYEVVNSCLFYNKLTLEFSFSDGRIIKSSLLPNRVSFAKNKKLINEKIALFEKRFNRKAKIVNPKRIIFIEYFLYYFCLVVKNIFVKLLMPNQWIIAYRKIGDKDWKFIEFKRNELMADPFIYYHDNKYYVFYESLNYDIDQGYIAVGELNTEKNKIINIKKAIDEDYHLSFPYIFKINFELYMIPESSENHTIDLYKCTKFPYKWDKVKTLINNIKAVDTVLIKNGKMWYLLTSEKVCGASYGDELTIFTSEDPLTKSFQRLSNIPAVHDVALARNAGSIYMNKTGNLYRVSQDCSRRYGYKVNVMKINQLSENEYREELISKFDLPKNTIAMHTYNFANEIEITDLKIINKDIVSLVRNAIRIFKKIIIRLMNYN
ncbi:glucosamine inositolphosphorylceramide transferase family protein [Photorhabdus luminescens]|uniref:glucosamine inositolphosphorylceramide transferase family protein n=1 Tax=Photorhabdus luminescens TaxID=29488 RepID=UPI00223EDD24|nr:hypothetical protein [Photorhabdus luminescens]MCW7762041.1 hypothetical protein [Photorhabdus luminescens subsp. venezuelensis]